MTFGAGVSSRGFAGLLPAHDTVAHHADVRVAIFDRPPGGVMRGCSKPVGTVED